MPSARFIACHLYTQKRPSSSRFFLTHTNRVSRCAHEDVILGEASFTLLVLCRDALNVADAGAQERELEAEK